MTEHDSDRQLVTRFLEAHSTLNLATCDGAAPWASAVFYASDDDLSLYFLTDPKTRRGQHLGSGRAAGTINNDVSRWRDIRGVQLEGTVEPVNAAQRETVQARYLAKFPELQDADPALWQRLQNTPFYRLRPRWLRLIDNSRQFGFRIELRLDQRPAEAP